MFCAISGTDFLSGPWTKRGEKQIAKGKMDGPTQCGRRRMGRNSGGKDIN